eukprot:scaffold111021_cov16-Tisochrysis_lutea.AAC.1
MGASDSNSTASTHQPLQSLIQDDYMVSENSRMNPVYRWACHRCTATDLRLLMILPHVSHLQRNTGMGM